MTEFVQAGLFKDVSPALQPVPFATAQDDRIPDRAVVLVSGGMDSAVALALAVQRFGPKNVYPISFLYGQRHTLEAYAAYLLKEHYGVEAQSKVIQLPVEIFRTDDSALTGNREMPSTTYAELTRDYGVSPTYVPYRNGTFMSMAASYALTIDAGWIYVGMHGEDSRNWAYPDCTPEFLGAVAASIYVGSYHKVRLVFPFIWMSKGEIAKLGLSLGVPFEKTISCYQGYAVPCGTCPTCIERAAAFVFAGAKDPLLTVGFNAGNAS